MELCNRCGEKSVVLDPAAGIPVCSACGVEQSSAIFEAQLFTSDGRATGAIIRSIGASSASLDRQIYHAENEIGEITSRIGLSSARSAEVRSLIGKITDGQFGSGDWFTVLVAACACIVMRRNRLPLTIAEAAAAISREASEVGSMMIRASNYLNLPPLPDLDINLLLERIMRNYPKFSTIEESKLEVMTNQSKFLLRCAVKWFLSTGRRPAPLVAAVVAFVAELNAVAVNLEEIAGYLHARASTCCTRKKELVETLIRVAKEVLPWGEDVTTKNILHHAPILLKFIERRSLNGDLDLTRFSSAINDVGSFNPAAETNIRGERLLEAYQKAAAAFKSVNPSAESAKSRKRTTNREIPLPPWMSGNIPVTEIDFDLPPPSFSAGIQARARRKEKIAAAKQRISRTKKRKFSDETTKGKKKKKKTKMEVGLGEIDMEDCLIELLLLHRVREEEIEEGQYNRLLDLHVFCPVEK